MSSSDPAVHSTTPAATSTPQHGSPAGIPTLPAHRAYSRDVSYASSPPPESTAFAGRQPSFVVSSSRVVSSGSRDPSAPSTARQSPHPPQRASNTHSRGDPRDSRQVSYARSSTTDSASDAALLPVMSPPNDCPDQQHWITFPQNVGHLFPSTTPPARIDVQLTVRPLQCRSLCALSPKRQRLEMRSVPPRPCTMRIRRHPRQRRDRR